MIVLSSLRLLFLFLLVNTYGQVLQSQAVEGVVVSITDGDTFKLLTQDSTQIKVRVANIDCPERKQPFYKRAKQFTSEAIFGKNVKLTILKKDRYGRSVALVTYDDSLDLSKELIKKGLAWHYIKYSDDQILSQLEEKAKQNKVGLWSDPNAIPPWDWRSSTKKKNKKE